MPTYAELQAMPPDQLDSEIDNLVANNLQQVCDDDAFCNCASGTNAEGWMTDDYDTDEPDFNDDAHEVRVPVTYHASGDQLEDTGFCGTEISGTATAVIDEAGHVTIEEVTAEVTGPDDEYDE